jgi:hypothetical protein
MEEFLNALYEPNDWVCSADNKYGNESKPLEEVYNNECYITLNALRRESTRADRNVTTLRNFLVEFDDLILDQQLDYVKKVGMPFTTCVFSGNKSFHFVLSLKEPCADKAEYDRIVRWLYAAVPEADPSCKNPSRFTRLGCGTHQNGTPQDIEILNERIDKEELLTWLATQCPEPEDVTKCAKQMADEDYFRIQESGYRAKLHKATVEFCKTGGRKGFRHKNIFIAACNLRDCYYTIEEAKFVLLRKLQEIYAAQDREDELELKERAVEDAYTLPPRVQTRS